MYGEFLLVHYSRPTPATHIHAHAHLASRYRFNLDASNRKMPATWSLNFGRHGTKFTLLAVVAVARLKPHLLSNCHCGKSSHHASSLRLSVQHRAALAVIHMRSTWAAITIIQDIGPNQSVSIQLKCCPTFLQRGG